MNTHLLNNRFISVFSRYFIVLIAILFLIGYFSTQYDGSHDLNGEKIPIIVGDGYGYYYYLPFYILNFDDVPFERLLSPSDYEPFWDKYQVGEALMILPFFLVAHLLSMIFSFPLDGYSLFYQHGAGLAGLFYALAGIYILKKILERYYSKKITLITLTAIIFGTNLYHYGTVGSLFSHSFSFFLISLIIYLIPIWFEEPQSIKMTAALSAIIGLAVLVRLPNAIVLIFLLFYKVHSIKDLKERFLLLKKNYKSLILFIVIVLFIFIPQIITWKLTFNQWFVYSYGEAQFHFQRLYISNILFSLRRGLLFWSPILLFGIVGFWFMREKKHDFFIPSLLILPLIVFINSSFSRWWFGASFGHRGFTEFLPIFSLTIASFYSSLNNKKIRILVYVLSALFIIYSILQMIIIWKGWIPHDLITLLSYKNLFTKLFSYLKSLF